MNVKVSIACIAALVAATTTAAAQETQQGVSGSATGEVSGSAAVTPPPPPAPPPPPPPADKPAPAARTVHVERAETGERKARVEPAPEGMTDHEQVIGKFAVGYFGFAQVPLATGVAPTGPVAPNAAIPVPGVRTINAPTIGVRYWLGERLGIDAGLGLGIASQSADRSSGNASGSTSSSTPIAIALHGGVPLVPAYGKHYKFLFVPEINLATAFETESAPGVPDQGRSGLLIDLGARVGTEIQFGFIGVPQLALQASVGLAFRRTSWRTAFTDAAGVDHQHAGSAVGLGTTVQSDPWAIFANNISALYYFP